MTAHTTTTTAHPSAVESDRGAERRVRIRRAGIEDAAVVRELLIELAEHEHTAHAVHASVGDWARMLADQAVVVLVAHMGDRPVGYVSGVRQLNLWVGRDILAMDDLYVRAEARDRGVGGELMAALADYADSDQLLVTWGVREDNEAGHRFYRRLGATLRTKVVAAWQPAAYATYVRDRVRE